MAVDVALEFALAESGLLLLINFQYSTKCMVDELTKRSIAIHVLHLRNDAKQPTHLNREAKLVKTFWRHQWIAFLRLLAFFEAEVRHVYPCIAVLLI